MVPREAVEVPPIAGTRTQAKQRARIARIFTDSLGANREIRVIHGCCFSVQWLLCR